MLAKSEQSKYIKKIKFIYMLFERITLAILFKLTLVFAFRKTMSCKMHITHDIWRVICL